MEPRMNRRKAKQAIREFSSRTPAATNDAAGNPWQAPAAEKIEHVRGTKRTRFCP
jgi:hypothetical protein